MSPGYPVVSALLSPRSCGTPTAIVRWSCSQKRLLDGMVQLFEETKNVKSNYNTNLNAEHGDLLLLTFDNNVPVVNRLGVNYTNYSESHVKIQELASLHKEIKYQIVATIHTHPNTGEKDIGYGPSNIDIDIKNIGKLGYLNVVADKKNLFPYD